MDQVERPPPPKRNLSFCWLHVKNVVSPCTLICVTKIYLDSFCLILIFDKQNTGFALFQRYKYNELVWSGFADIQQVTKNLVQRFVKKEKYQALFPDKTLIPLKTFLVL